MALDSDRRLREKTDSAPAAEPSIIIDPAYHATAEAVQAKLKDLSREEPSIVVSQEIRKSAGFREALQATQISPDKLLEYVAPEAYLPPIRSFRDAAGYLGINKTLIQNDLASLQQIFAQDTAFNIAEFKQLNDTLKFFNTLKPAQSDTVKFSACYTSFHTEIWKLLAGNKRLLAHHSQYPEIARLYVNLINYFSRLKAAYTDGDFFNPERDQLLATTHQAFLALIEQSLPAGTSPYLRINSQVVAPDLSNVTFNVSYHQKEKSNQAQPIQLKIIGKTNGGKMMISSIENHSEHPMAITIAESLLGKSITLSNASIGPELIGLSNRIGTISEPQMAAPAPINTTQAPTTTTVETPQKPNIVERAKSWFRSILKGKTENATTAKPQNRSSWRSLGFAAALALLHVGPYKTTQTQAAAANTTPTTSPTIRPQASNNNLAARVDATTETITARGSVHAGLAKEQLRHASIERGLISALQSPNGQAMIAGLYPTSELSATELGYLAQNLAHRIGLGVNLHTRNNQEVVHISHFGSNNDGTQLFEVNIGDSNSSFVNIALPTLRTIHHQAERHSTQPASAVRTTVADTGDNIPDAQQDTRSERIRSLRARFDELRATAAARRSKQAQK